MKWCDTAFSCSQNIVCSWSFRILAYSLLQYVYGHGRIYLIEQSNFKIIFSNLIFRRASFVRLFVCDRKLLFCYLSKRLCLYNLIHFYKRNGYDVMHDASWHHDIWHHDIWRHEIGCHEISKTQPFQVRFKRDKKQSWPTQLKQHN